MKKSEPPKASQCEDGVDFISNMPDSILVLILSHLLCTEEQIRSSILSRRWRYLWTAIPSLDVRFREKCYGGKFEKSEFKEFVYWVLVNKSVDLDSFGLYCYNHFSIPTVGRWIHAAVGRNVKQLILGYHSKERTEAIELPHCLVTCGSLEVFRLDLMLSRLSLPKYVGFPALRVLNLCHVDFLDSDDLVKDFLESCPSLEDLSLTDCWLWKLDLWISCPKLKRLSIVNLDDVGCRSIKISCPKLVDLDLAGHINCNFIFERLDSLKKAVIEPKFEGNTTSVLFPGISGVEYLSIDLYFFSECINAASDPALPKLKALVLNTSMDAFTMDNFNQILKHYPKLESLELIIKQDDGDDDDDADGDDNDDNDDNNDDDDDDDDDDNDDDDDDDDDEYDYEWLEEVETRRLFTPDVKRVEFLEFSGEKPKVVIDRDEVGVEMVFSWGKKLRFSHW